MPVDLSAKLTCLCPDLSSEPASGTAPDAPGAPGLLSSPEDLNLDRLKQQAILLALESTQGNKTKAAERLGITREGLRKQLLKMQR